MGGRTGADFSIRCSGASLGKREGRASRHYRSYPEDIGEPGIRDLRCGMTLIRTRKSGPSPGHHARSVHRTVIACAGQKSLHKKHMQQSSLFSGYTPSPLIMDKDTHRAEVYAPVFCMAMAGPAAEVRIDVHLSPYRCCGSDFHERAPVTRARRETAPGFLSELFGYLL